MMNAPTLLEAVTNGVGTERPFLCPVHADTRPSASVNVLKNVWICYTCGAHGKVEGEVLAGDPNFTAVVEFIDNAMAEDMYYSEGWLNQFDAAGPGEYWLSRFSSVACTHFRLGQDMVDQTPVYPLRDPTGRVLGVVRRTGFAKGPKYLYPKGIDIGQLLFNYSYQQMDRIVLVEGAADAIACWDVSVEAFAIYGSRLSFKQKELIERLEPQHIVCAFDNDPAGYGAYLRVKSMFKGVTVSKVDLGGAKDIAELNPTRRKAVLDYGDVYGVVSETCSSQRGNSKGNRQMMLSPAIGTLSWP